MTRSRPRSIRRASRWTANRAPKEAKAAGWKAKLSALLRDMRRIERGIARLPSVERRIIRRHYLSGQTWEAVADAESYSYVQIWRIKKRAIARLENAK